MAERTQQIKALKQVAERLAAYVKLTDAPLAQEILVLERVIASMRRTPSFDAVVSEDEVTQVRALPRGTWQGKPVPPPPKR